MDACIICFVVVLLFITGAKKKKKKKFTISDVQTQSNDKANTDTAVELQDKLLEEEEEEEDKRQFSDVIYSVTIMHSMLLWKHIVSHYAREQTRVLELGMHSVRIHSTCTDFIVLTFNCYFFR